MDKEHSASGEERPRGSRQEGQHGHRQMHVPEGGVVRKAYWGQVCLHTLLSPPRPQAVLWCPWLNGLPHRWWSCRRRWLRKTRPWASWSRASASWRRPPSTAPSSGRSPMSPGAATSQPVAGPSASSPQVPAPQGRRPAGGGRLPWARETSRARGQLPDCQAVSECIRATLGARR